MKETTDSVKTFLDAAQKAAEKGDIKTMESNFKSLKVIKKETNIYVPSEILKIKTVGYNKALALSLQDCEVFAERGSLGTLDDSIAKAKKFARFFNKDISDLTARYKIDCYLNLAKKKIKSKNPTLFQVYTGKAQEFADKAGIDISDQINCIEKKASERRELPDYF